MRRQFLGFVEQDGRRIACFSAELDADCRPGREVDEWTICANCTPRWAIRGFNWRGALCKLWSGIARTSFVDAVVRRWSSVANERAKRCTECGLSNYPRLSPAIIIAVTREVEGEKRILLARNHRFPAGRYSVLAGFVEPGESLEECAVREVMEEVGIEIDNIRYVASQPWPFPNSLMLGFTAEYVRGDFQLGGCRDCRSGLVRRQQPAQSTPKTQHRPPTHRRVYRGEQIRCYNPPGSSKLPGGFSAFYLSTCYHRSSLSHSLHLRQIIP